MFEYPKDPKSCRSLTPDYSTAPCYVHCRPNAGKDMHLCSPTVFGELGDLAFCPDVGVACQAACWRGGPDMTNNILYGYNDIRLAGPA